MKSAYMIGLGLVLAAPVVAVSFAKAAPGEARFTETFLPETRSFSSAGSNPFFILQPGYQQVYDGTEDGEKVHLTITVTNRTQKVAGVQTRVVEEREIHNGQLVEVSRNYFAICKPNNSVFYFGEQVDNYSKGKLVNHGGSWQAGLKGAKPGLVMPGLALLGSRFAQELAPGQAMDRAEIISLSETLQTPAGLFKNCLRTEETSPLEPGSKEYKLYALGIGLIEDGDLKLSKVIKP